MKRSLTFLAVWLATSAAQADNRVALVIGNGAYRYVDALTNPRLDARTIKAALERLGFKVVYGEDLDQKHLGQKIAEFAGEAQDADVALTYYAGHGSTFGDMSYLVPIDAEFKSLAAVTYELVPLEQMLGELRRGKGIRIAIIDACRDNAKERELKRVAQRGGAVSRGLTRVQSPDGLILAFSTQYGMTAADGAPNTNSPFTAALVRQLATPGLDVRDVFFNAGRDVLLSTNNTQRPAIEVSLYEPYTLVPAPPAGVLSSVPPVPAPAQTAAQMAALPPVVPAPVVAPPLAVNPRRQELIAACDRLAAMEGDLDMPVGVSPVAFDKIDANAAIPACRVAVEAAQANPSSSLTRLSSIEAEQATVDERRMRSQLGLVLSRSEQFTEAKVQFERATALGSAAGMFGLGILYYNGLGVAQDQSKGLNWYVKAADIGFLNAMFGAGDLYEHGNGVPQDYAKARSWYEKAAKKGEPNSMYNLASLYANGQGGAQNYAIARSWYEKAAEKGGSKAMYSLGLLYANGQGGAQNYATARSWYEKAAEKGESKAMYNLGVLYATGQGVARDDVKAVTWYEKAANKGDTIAMTLLGFLYANGTYIGGYAKDKRNYTIARSWYEKAASKGNPNAMTLLADLYAYGLGGPQDYVAARSWYEKAAAAGDADAPARLAKLSAKSRTKH